MTEITESERAMANAIIDKYTVGMDKDRRAIVQRFATMFANQAYDMMVGASVGNAFHAPLGLQVWTHDQIQDVVKAAMAVALDLLEHFPKEQI